MPASIYIVYDESDGTNLYAFATEAAALKYIATFPPVIKSNLFVEEIGYYAY